jgi:cell wall-associated NlpC family hydrolase
MIKYNVINPIAELHEVPDEKALRGKLESQLVYGEEFIAEKEQSGWLFGTCAHDGYAGWINKKDMSATGSTATHIILAQRSHVYADATMKSPLLQTLSIGSRINILEQGEKFSRAENLGWIYNKDILPADKSFSDPVLCATLFAETPYVWGGRSGFGIDCSGLVQVTLGICGIKTPRDTEQQVESIGKDVTGQNPRMGDLIFFKGHVGIMCGDDIILHANAFHMKTCIEPLSVVADRSGGITRIRRFD